MTETLLTTARPLDHDDVIRLLGEVRLLEFRILRRLEPVEAAEPAAAPLTIDEAAQRLGVSVSWLYRTAHTLPFAWKPNGHNWRFDARGIERYVRQRQGAGG